MQIQPMFGAFDRAVSGATAARTWLDAISDNIANLNTVRPAEEDPFRARQVVVRSVENAGGVGEGVEVVGILQKGGQAQRVYDPDHPFADATGSVTRPVVDLGEEMTNMLLAQRTYQANLAVVDRVRDAYLAALKIGQR